MADARGLAVQHEDVLWLRRRVRRWFSEHGRDFAWRRTSDPYEVLIAELLLQRTRADLVPSVYTRFIERFPDPAALADATVDEVVDVLRPLGLLHRSARLPALGRAIVENFDGRVPRTEAALLALPGVGRYVASAVLLLAFDQPRALLDPNVIRLLERCLAVRSARTRARDDRGLWELAQRIVAGRVPRPIALGLIDLGALICLPRRPLCGQCPLRVRCVSFHSGAVVPRDGR